jgi:uncharacterized membrane protein
MAGMRPNFENLTCNRRLRQAKRRKHRRLRRLAVGFLLLLILILLPLIAHYLDLGIRFPAF